MKPIGTAVALWARLKWNMAQTKTSGTINNSKLPSIKTISAANRRLNWSW